ncbi:hypothetical protein ES702_03136 [subsurface metagenome]
MEVISREELPDANRSTSLFDISWADEPGYIYLSAHHDFRVSNMMSWLGVIFVCWVMLLDLILSW